MGHTTDYNIVDALCMLGTQGCKRMQRLSNTYCFSVHVSQGYVTRTLSVLFFISDPWSLHSIIVPVHSFIHSVFCLTTGPKPPPKRCLHIVRSRASSFKWEYPLLSLKSSSSFLRILPRLLATSISPFIFPSITCFRRQFLRKMRPIQLAFRFIISSYKHRKNFFSSNVEELISYYIDSYLYIPVDVSVIVSVCLR